MLSKHPARRPFRLVLFLALAAGFSDGGRAAENLLASLNDTDYTAYVDDPWGSVVNGVITAQPGAQLAVDDNGNVRSTIFGPSVAVGDLNGDGLPDIVMADAKGYFWFFPNSGTSTVPKFTTGEVMPIWIGAPPPDGIDDQGLLVKNLSTSDNAVPRIQLVDFSGEHRLSIVAGNYEGKLFYIHNTGSSTQPNFSMPNDLASITVPTYSDNKLWCNFLSPFLYDFTGSGHLDLVMGEGTYASNSIYLLVNKGINGSPIFSERATTKVIPGYGREHLTPQVVDWNNDGKPDVICGERQGFIDLFLNTSTDTNPAHQQFNNPPPPAPPQHISCGGQQQFGLLSTVAVGDLTGNKRPNLVISNSDGHLSYALNKGTPGSPAFDLPKPINAVNPLPKVFQAPPNWEIHKAYSMPYVLLASTKLKDDPTFKPPEDAPTVKSALKIYTVPHQHTYFRSEVFPSQDTHLVQCDTRVTLEAGAHYDLSFYAKTDGTVDNLRCFFLTLENLVAQGIRGPNVRAKRYVMIPNQVSATGDWTHVKLEVKFDPVQEGKHEAGSFTFYLAFNGNGGTVWVTDFNMTKRP